MYALGFKAGVDLLTCILCRLHAMDSSGATPADHLVASMIAETLIHILAHVKDELCRFRQLRVYNRIKYQ